MSEELGFALIGCGKISNKHLHVLDQLAGARAAVLYDRDPQRAHAQQKKAPEARVARDLDAVLGDPQVGAVTICTPSGAHAELAMAAARAGKHVIVEKPLALTLEDADRMIDACDAAGVKLFVVKQNRYNRPVVAARRALEAGRFGRLFLGGARVLWHRDQGYYDAEPWRGTWAQDGGVCANQAAHHIDLLLWFMGDVVSVFATGSTVLHDIETEDTATVLLRFRHGATATLQATTCTQPRDLEGSLALFGTRGSVEIGGFAATELRTWMFAEESAADEAVRADWCANPRQFAYNHQQFYEDVLQTVISDRRALIDGIEGRRSLEVIHAIYESMETGREVALRFESRQSRLGSRPAEEKA
ncbi:MAG: gfo/Idh/MocA family oxidoreductase [Candidatus Eisenbacteria bacterium]|nr:gfo/Idh/MocA family oxidoreductase [Candidatus Eisenbacteria bacterium]